MARGEISREELIRQIDVLKRNLIESEQGWAQTKLTRLPNVVADSIRRQIAEKEAQLATL